MKAIFDKCHTHHSLALSSMNWKVTSMFKILWYLAYGLPITSQTIFRIFKNVCVCFINQYLSNLPLKM